MNNHPLAGKSVVLNPKGNDDQVRPGAVFRIEDYWLTLTGKSWGDSNGNPAALKYAFRAGFAGLPTDDEVVYGKIGGLGHLVHVSELGEVVE